VKLIIGNKNYSSWSLRPWIALKVAGIAFEEEVISLDAKDFKARVSKVSGTGKVPALADGNVYVWESLAILEYLAEKYPSVPLWPADPAARALARAIASEMHAGFVPLRRHLPMNMRRPVMPRQLTPEAHANVRRIEAIWTDCRTHYGTDGAFLFRGRDVCAGGVPISYLCGGGGGHGSRLHGRGYGAARLGRMAGGGARGTLGAARRRGGLADRRAGMSSCPRGCDIAPKKSQGCVLIPARGRKKTTPIL